MKNAESIEEEYNLEKVLSTRGKQVITQSREYIFYYQYTKKTGNSSVYKCSYYRDKAHPCNAFIILTQDNNFDQKNYNLEHSDHELKTEEIKTLFEKEQINKIVKSNQNIYLLNTINVKEKMASSMDITKTKNDNLKHNINNTLKKLKPEEPDSISNIEIDDENFIDIENENIVIYKDLNILFLSKRELGKIAYENNKDIFLDATFKSCNK